MDTKSQTAIKLLAEAIRESGGNYQRIIDEVSTLFREDGAAFFDPDILLAGCLLEVLRHASWALRDLASEEQEEQFKRLLKDSLS